MINHDKILVNIFFGKKYINPNKTTKLSQYPNISNYIANRYKDSSSRNETFWRMKYHIEKRPTCKLCGGMVTFTNKTRKLFKDFCCAKCAQNYQETKNKYKSTCLLKYNVEFPMQSLKVQQNAMQTCINRYGVSTPLKSNVIKEKIKNTLIKKYGVKHTFSSNVIREKIKSTFIKKYGVKNPSELEFVRNKISNSHKLEIVKQKTYNTKKKNNSFGPQSKSESICYLYLSLYYPDTIRQYRDNKRYPYNCDFYIPSLDLFIEFQGYYTHGKHPYNSDSVSDKLLIEKYKEKYGKNCQAITIWTIKDPEKRKCAKEHSLNWKEFFTIDELKDWLENG